MKKRSKRLLATALVTAILCSMVTGWANTAVIDSITVTPTGDNPTVRTYQPTAADIVVNPSDLVSVKVKIMDATPAAIAAAEATFFSYVNAASDGGTILNNDTVQYLDQQTTAADLVGEGEEPGEAYATFTFRPRMNADGTGLLLSGAHTAMAGGTDVIDLTNSTFTYTVKDPAFDMTVTAGANTSFTVSGATADATFTIGVTALTAVTAVKLGEAALTADTEYTYSNGTLTILQSKLNALASGSYTLTVSAEGYNDGTLTNAITVNVAAEGDVHQNDRVIVQEGLEDLVVENAANGNEITLPANKVGGYDVNYEIVNDTEEDGVAIENGVLKLDTTMKPFAKVELEVYAGTGDTCKDVKTVYIVPEPENVGFGNIGLHTDGAADPFVYSAEVTQEEFMEKVNALDSTAKANDLATALNIVLYDRQEDIDALPHFEGALDYVKDGKLTLAEYRIYKLMMSGGSGHTFEEVNTKRAQFQPVEEN